jgi:hypothetical protein
MTRARLPSDPCDLLREVGPEPVPEAAFERMALRLEASLAGAGVGAPSGAIATPQPGAWRGVSSVFSSPAVSLPLVFALGVAAGVAGALEFRGDSEPAASLVPPSALVSAAPKLDWPPPAPARVEVTLPVAPSGPPPSAAPASNLGLERGLLDRARAKMAAGETEAAFAVLTQHARSYPRGLLSEEREAMAVNALVALGRASEARRRGRAFHERYPSSLVGRSVEAALATLAPRDSE